MGSYHIVNNGIPICVLYFYFSFLHLHGMPNTLGAVDGTHIGIATPPLNHPTAPGNLFFNRKGFYSINCQMVIMMSIIILN